MTPTSEKNKVSCSYIHDDIALSILSKLRIKSLKRFTCVCKSWSLLFQNPNFINLFRNNLVSKSRYDDDDDDVCFLFVSQWFLYLVSGERFQNVVKLDLLPSPLLDRLRGRAFYPRIFSSTINGIVCVHSRCHHNEVALWNPVTQEVKVIPPGLVENRPDIHAYSCLHGFGYDHVRDDCKVIRHVRYSYISDCYPRKEDSPMLPDSFWEIYSLRSDSWRKIIVDKPIPHFLCSDSEVYLNGVCHWLGVSDEHKTVVVSLNLADDVFFTTPTDWPHCSSRLVVLNGSIAMITNYISPKSCTISILGEIGVKESWTKLFNIGPLSSTNNVIATGKNGNIFLYIKNGKLACFDLTTEVIVEIGFKEESRIYQILHNYKKNLGPIELLL